MIFREYVKGDIIKNRKSYISSMITIFLAVLILSTFIFGLYSYYESYKQLLSRSTGGYHFRLSNPISNKAVRDIKDNRYVNKVGLMDSYISNEGLGSKSNTQVIKLDENAVANLGAVLKEGQIPSENEVLISANLSNDIGKKIGDKLHFEKKDYRISGTYYDTSYDYQDIYDIFIHKNQDELLATKKPLSLFVWYKNIFRTYSVSQKIMDNLGDEDIAYNYNTLYLDKSFVFDPETSLVKDHQGQLAAIVLFCILIFLFYSIISNLFFVQEAKSIKEYSLLKSVGARTSEIKQIIKLKAIYLSILPIILGGSLSLILLKVLFFIIRKVENNYKIAGEFLLGKYLDLHFSFLLAGLIFIISFIIIYLGSKKPIKKLKKNSIIDGLKGNVKNKSYKKYDLKYTGNIEKDLSRQFFKNSKRSFLFTGVSLKLGFLLMSFIMLMLTFYSMHEKYNHIDKYNSYNIQGEFASLRTADDKFLQEVKSLDLDDFINFRNESVYLDYDRNLISKDYSESGSLESLEEEISSLDNIKISLVGLEDEKFNELVSKKGLKPERYKDGRVLLLNTMGDNFHLPLSRINNIEFLKDDIKEIKLSEYGNILDDKGYEFTLNIEDKIDEPLFDYAIKKDRLYAYMPKSEYMKLFDKFKKIADLDQFEYVGMRAKDIEDKKEALEDITQNYFKEGNFYINSKTDDLNLVKKNTITGNILSVFFSIFFIVVGFSNCYFAFYNLFLKRKDELYLYKAIGIDKNLLSNIFKEEKKKIIFSFLWAMPVILIVLTVIVSKITKMFTALELLLNINYIFIISYILIIYLSISKMYNAYVKKTI